MEPGRRESLGEPLLSPPSFVAFFMPLQLTIIHNLRQLLIIKVIPVSKDFFLHSVRFLLLCTLEIQQQKLFTV